MPWCNCKAYVSVGVTVMKTNEPTPRNTHHSWYLLLGKQFFFVFCLNAWTPTAHSKHHNGHCSHLWHRELLTFQISFHTPLYSSSILFSVLPVHVSVDCVLRYVAKCILSVHNVTTVYLKQWVHCWRKCGIKYWLKLLPFPASLLWWIIKGLQYLKFHSINSPP